MMVRYLSEEGKNVGFRIYYPQEEITKYQEFSCRFETFGLKDNISGSALGVDAIDAMVNAMMRVDIFLKSSEECEIGNIRWIGGIAPNDFGLPWNSAKRC